MIMFFCSPGLLIYAFFVQNSLAAPTASQSTAVQTEQSKQYVQYMGDPNGRGTLSLIISCVLTLTLCVRSALHLNVPSNSQTSLNSLMAQFRWIVTGVYAPELVVFTAWRQWSSAKLLTYLVKKRRKHTNTNIEKWSYDVWDGRTVAPHSLSREWTMTHSFFASTGGFAFEIANDGAQDLPNGCKRLTLTARGVALLASCGHLPNVSKAEITDKSKANNVAKALVIIQASWMLVQVIGRLVAALPVTLLEVNTIAHVMCAFLMYAMWWHKPLAPKEPILLKGEWVKSICAYMYMSSEMSGEVDAKSIESQTVVKTLFASMRLYSKVPEMSLLSFHQSAHIPDTSVVDRFSDISSVTVFGLGSPDEHSPGEASEYLDEVNNWPLPFQGLIPAAKTCLTELQAKRVVKAASTAFFERRPRVKGIDLARSAISDTCIRRWALATTAIDTYPTIREHHLFHSHHEDRCLHFKSEEFLVRRVRNWPSDDLLRDVGGLVVGMVLWLACLAYGAVHLSAWNDHFPTVAEQWLWPSSSLYIGFCGGLWIALNYLAQSFGPLNAFWEKWMDRGGRWWQNFLIGAPVLVCGVSLVLARAFIVVEAFISIRELPVAAYDTPTWTQVFPHF